tara:strand:+ start:2957 stop:3592 length:636 start_codon:yes stop_codon:yes gene_type:complete
MSKKRNCIFTGKPSDFKMTFTSTEDDIHNWASKVPATKEYVGESGLLHRALNKREMKLVELFFEQEVARLRASNIEAQMAEIRLEGEEDDAWLDADLGETAYLDEPLAEPVLLDLDGKIKEEYAKLEEEDLGNCLKCDAKILMASGIGPFCPNAFCGVADGPEAFHLDEPDTPLPPEVWEKELVPTKVLTEEKEDVIVEKKIVTKKKGLWD